MMPKTVYMGPAIRTDVGRKSPLAHPAGRGGFWIFSILALVILAGTVLAPLWVTHRHLVGDRMLVVYQNEELARRVEDLTHQAAALTSDPQYTERITRRELKLRKPGEEVVTIEPMPITPPPDQARVRRPADYSNRWWMRVFLASSNRPWLLALSAGLLFSAMMVSMGQRSRAN